MARREAEVVSITHEQLLQLARVAAKPGTLAMLIEGANQRFARLLPIEAAITAVHHDAPDKTGARSTYTIDPDDAVIPIDGDDPSRAAQLDMFAARCRKLGLRPVLQASGRPGHRHLWVRVEDARLRARLIAFAEELEIGIRVRQRMRPLLAPHRLGLPVYLIEPTDPAEALRCLSPTVPVSRETLRKHQKSVKLPPTTERLLVEGDVDGKYLHKDNDGTTDHSAMLMAILCSAVQTGYDFETLWSRGRDPRNAGGARLQCDHKGVEISEARARDDFERSWEAAKAFVERFPAMTHGPTIAPEIEEIRALAHERITGRTADTDLVVLDTILDKALALNRLDVGYSQRELGEAVKCDAWTARSASLRLRASGWLDRRTKGRGENASVYVIRTPPDVATSPNAPLKVCERNDWGELRRRLLFRSSIAGTRALGPAAGKLLAALIEAGEPLTRKDVVRRGLSRDTLQRALRRLRVHDLVRVDKGGRLSVPDDIDELMAKAEKDLCLHQAEAARRKRYSGERERYREALEELREAKQARITAALVDREEIDTARLRSRRSYEAPKTVVH